MDAQEGVFETQAKPTISPGDFFFLVSCLYGLKLAKIRNLGRKLFCLLSFKRGEHSHVENSFYILNLQFLVKIYC